MNITVRTLAGDLPLSGVDPGMTVANVLQALVGAARQAGVEELPSRLVFKGRALTEDTLSAAGVNDGDSLVGLPRREPREPRIGTPADQSPDEAMIMAVTSEEAKRRGLPTDGTNIRSSAAQQPARRHASTMQDAIGAELLGLLEQAVPGFVPGSLGVPEGGGEAAAPVQVPEPNAEAAARLADMGFPEAVARRALLLTRNRLDAATEWCLSHGDDPDAADPPTEEQLRRVYGRAAAAARAMPVVADAADPALVQQLQEMGFPEHMARAALRRFGNDVEMACQALLSAGALEGEGAVAAEGRAGVEEEHGHVAGTSEDARGDEDMDLSGDGGSEGGASVGFHSEHSGDSVPGLSDRDDSDDDEGQHDHDDDDDSEDDDGEDEHGVDGRLAMDMPRPAEDDYEDGLQDMDMMPGDMGMGMGEMNFFDGVEGFGIQELLERVGSGNEGEFMEDIQQSPQMIDAIQMMLSDPSSYAPLVEHPELAPYMRALRRMVGMEDSNPEGPSPTAQPQQATPPVADQPTPQEDGEQSTPS